MMGHKSYYQNKSVWIFFKQLHFSIDTAAFSNLPSSIHLPTLTLTSNFRRLFFFVALKHLEVALNQPNLVGLGFFKWSNLWRGL